jgi:hypothetical protein
MRLQPAFLAAAQQFPGKTQHKKVRRAAMSGQILGEISFWLPPALKRKTTMTNYQHFNANATDFYTEHCLVVEKLHHFL